MAELPPRNRLEDASKVGLLSYLSEQKSTSNIYNQRSMFWDREHVYNENLMLRNKIKELETTNTKTKTRLLRTEKDLSEMSSNSNRKGFDLGLRSSSTTHMRPEAQLATLKWRVESLREEEHTKKLLLMKRKMRQLRE